MIDFDISNCVKFNGKICIPANEKIKKVVMNEAYSTLCTVHPDFIKTYQDLKKHFWWPGMRKTLLNMSIGL